MGFLCRSFLHYAFHTYKAGLPPFVVIKCWLAPREPNFLTKASMFTHNQFISYYSALCLASIEPPIRNEAWDADRIPMTMLVA